MYGIYGQNEKRPSVLEISKQNMLFVVVDKLQKSW